MNEEVEITAHNNTQLFSNYYLNEILPKGEEWRNVPNLEEKFEELKKLHEESRRLVVASNEPQTEKHFVRPALERLGHIFEVQTPINTKQRTITPDYTFFASPEDREEAAHLKGEKEYFRKALAIGDAKRWNRNLDKASKEYKDPFANTNPNYQIDSYLRHTNTRWGILTNGPKWRLYNIERSFSLDTYYEVDLVALLEQGDLNAFKYFYLFFRQEAFIEIAGKSFLDKVYAESSEYTAKLEEDLKERVYKALPLIAQGFLDYPGNDLDPKSDLKEIYDHSLILLYRLLFILYAESRDRLPLKRNRDYADSYSLSKIKQEIADKIDKDYKLNPKALTCWSSLKDLFHLIDQGWEEIDIFPYNGGLFDPSRNEFLEKFNIGELYIAQCIDLLSRTKGDEGQQVFIDYQSLGIRHLGSIYEGLLEYKLEIAEEEKVEPNTYGAGEVYLVNDKGERKASGSYYTPDYIVKYIVENTLEPLCESRTKEEILALKILDPAMGSGHFLVSACDFLANAIMEAPAEDEDSEVAKIEEDIDDLKRLVVEKCLFGVDLNPLAVELAKLSLWLHTFVSNKPLNFLDHHFRCGNSLIGARIGDLGKLPNRKDNNKKGDVEQMDIFQDAFKSKVSILLDFFEQIEDIPSDTRENIKAKEELYKEAKDMTRRFREVADIWTSCYFGNKVQEYDNLLVNLKEDDSEWQRLAEKDWFKRGVEIGRERRFFHWELEFPEVFFEGSQWKDNPGFDAVIGNPPYGLKFEKYTRLFINELYAIPSKNDSASMFIIRALELGQSQKYIGVIVPKPITYVKSWEDIRSALLDHKIEKIIDVSRAFEDALQEQVVLIINKARPNMLFRSHIGTVGIDKISMTYSVSMDKFDKDIFPIWLNEINRVIFDKVWSCSDRLSKGIGYSFEGPGYNKYLKTRGPGYLSYNGSDIGRYVIRSSHYIEEELIKSEIERYEGDKILLQRIVAHVENPFPRIIITATIDRENAFTVNTLTDVKPIGKYSAYYLLSIFNSMLFSWYGYNFVYNRAIRSMDLYPSYLELFPIRLISFTTPEKERKRLVTDLVELYEKHIGINNYLILENIEERLVKRYKPDLELVKMHNANPLNRDFQIPENAVWEQSDVIHDFLAFLAEQMIEMNKVKQEEMKGFLKWLSREIGGDIDALSNKTKIRSYNELTFAELLDILKRNKNRLAIDPSSRKFQDRLEPTFNESLEKLNPLVDRISATDKLIDQIVYKLYGLTEEEIAIVEGKV